MGVLGSRIDPLRPLAERRRRSPLHPTTRQNRDLNLQPSLVMHLLLDSWYCHAFLSVWIFGIATCKLKELLRTSFKIFQKWPMINSLTLIPPIVTINHHFCYFWNYTNSIVNRTSYTHTSGHHQILSIDNHDCLRCLFVHLAQICMGWEKYFWQTCHVLWKRVFFWNFHRPECNHAKIFSCIIEKDLLNIF